MNIEWSLIGQAIDFYSKYDFQYIEVPWTVSSEAIAVTLPIDKYGFLAWHPKKELGFLVGSAEQSFIQMMISGKLDPGRYSAATPCFREDDIDQYHLPYFFKIELIDTISESVNDTLSIAKSFFDKLSLKPTEILETSDNCYDIYLNGIEIGSYGLRRYQKYAWVYGTGLALPRFSQARNLE